MCLHSVAATFGSVFGGTLFSVEVTATAYMVRQARNLCIYTKNRGILVPGVLEHATIMYVRWCLGKRCCGIWPAEAFGFGGNDACVG